eukprot:1879104-Pyramimonas_sp.AAC.1
MVVSHAGTPGHGFRGSLQREPGRPVKRGQTECSVVLVFLVCYVSAACPVGSEKEKAFLAGGRTSPKPSRPLR